MANTTIDTLEVRITANAKSAADSLNALAKALDKVKTVLSGVDKDGLRISERMAKSINEMGGAINSITTGSIKRLQKMANALNSYADACKNVKAAGDISKQLKNVMNTLNGTGTTGGASSSARSAAPGTALARYGSSAGTELATTGTALARYSNESAAIKRAFQSSGAFGSSPGVIDIDVVVRDVSGMASSKGGSAEVGSPETLGKRSNSKYDFLRKSGVFSDVVKKQEQADTLKKMGVFASKADKEAKGLAGTLGKVRDRFKGTTGWAGKFVKAIGRIALYRAIRSALKSISDAFSEGLKSAYAFSAQSDNFRGLADTLDHLKSITSQMVNQLGAFAGELIQFVAPALEWVIEKVRKLAETLTEFFAALNGKDYYQVAVLEDLKWDEALAGIKEYKKQLLGLDELNNITSNKSDDTDASKKYELKEVSDRVKGIALTVNGILGFLGGAFATIKDLVLSPVGMAAVGALLIFTPHFALGLGLVFAGVSWGVAEIILNWSELRKKVKKAFKKYKALFAYGAVGAVAVGALLLFTQHYIAGIACILAGTGLAAATLAFNWDSLLESVKQAFEGVLNWLKEVFIPDFLKQKEIIQSPLVVNPGYETVPGYETSPSYGTATEPSSVSSTLPAYQRVQIPKSTLATIGEVVMGLGVAIAVGKGFKGVKGMTEKDLALDFKAAGGVPTKGTLFYAGESGPEFVGSMGGNTAVANTEQMTEAIYKAAYMGMSKALKENGGNGLAGFTPATTDDLFIAMRKKASNYTRMTGSSAFT